MDADGIWGDSSEPTANLTPSGCPSPSTHTWSRADTPLDLRPYDRWAPLRADAGRFGLLGRLVITLLVWFIPGTGLWTMAVNPGTVFFVFAFAWVPGLAAVALYISIAVWRK